MSSWKQKVLTEYKELLVKYDNLSTHLKTISTSPGESVESYHNALLLKQLISMEEYLTILSSRIALFKHLPD